MKKNIFISLLSALVYTPCILMISSSIQFKGYAIDKTNTIDYTKYGLGAEEVDYIGDVPYYLDSNSSIELFSTNTANDLSSSVDLSTTSYFPPIGNQDQVGSCVAWATTYYQFTYEANKLNNITTTNENAYSPTWTFNFWNGGCDVGSNHSVAYDILFKHGAVHWNEQPYQTFDKKLDNINADNFDFNWCTNTEAMIQALNTRLTNYHEIDIYSKQTPITNNQSQSLNSIKEVLYGTNGKDGKVLNIEVVATAGLTNWSYGHRANPETGENIYITDAITNNLKEEIVVYRAEGGTTEEYGGHSMTIVGYDDNVWCDINNNQEVDEGELGAFKVANSWGEDWYNNGYVWVAYDALNYRTSIKDNQENDTDLRISIFDRNRGGANRFYYINVENKSPMYVGQLEINTNYRNTLKINAGKNTSETLANKSEKFKQYTTRIRIDKKWVSIVNNVVSHNGTLVFDYDDLCEPISDYINGYNWFVNVDGNHNSLFFKITDNLSNTIVDFGNISTGDSYKPINLSMGDLDYNGIVDVNDSKILFNSIYNNEKLSNLQEYLASNMNKDFSVHAAITPSGYDDIGKVLDNLNAGNIVWDSVPSDVSLQTLIDGNYDVLFINCSSNIKTNGEVIKAFVEQGGTVYASDWALDALIEAFPERNITYTTANSQNIIADVADRGLNTSTGLETVPVNFNLSNWRLINSTLQEDVNTYIKGSVKEENNDTFPLAFSFPYGNNGGKVFYTSFHHEANMTDEMQNVLNDLILTINHNKDINDINEFAQKNQSDSIMYNVGIIDANKSSKSYVLDKLESSTEFAVITNETGNFSIELTAPNGNVYTNYKNGEFLYGLVSGSSDSIQVYSLGKRGLRISNPNILSNEDNHWSYRVISHLPYRSSFVTGVAEKNEKTVFDYIIDYKVTQDWGTGQNVEVTITNIGDTPIRNWALQCDNFFGTVSHIWNGKLQGDNIIRNDITNSDIASGSSITIGYTLTNATGEVPEFTLCSFRNAKNDGYSVDFDVLSDWGEGFVGTITITNTTDTPIMAWELNFNAENFIISATSQFEILKNIGNNYTITGTYNGNIPIPAYSSVILQFNGEKTGIPSISDILMTEMIIKE
ncbi:MAG: cellulose binding domain-containing protein [Alistipes senegalensis]|nr:cellulose binding domain-containing protein [Alistipes senegalensis]